MADEERQPEGQPVQVEFTEEQQAMINEIISKRLAEKSAKFDAEKRDIEDRHKRELEKVRMDDESRRQADIQDQIDALTKRAEAAERQNRVIAAERECVKAGLDPELAETLMGADDKAMAKNIEAVVKAAKALADRQFAERVGTTGAPRAPEGSSDTDEAELRRIMGLS